MQLDDTTPKTCNRCGITKTRADFYKNPLMPDGLLKQCIACVKKAKKDR